NTYLSFYSTHHQCLYRSRYPAHRRAHSFPTRRSSDLHQRELTRLRIRIEDLGREELTRDVQIPRVVRGSVERRVHHAPGLPDLSFRRAQLQPRRFQLAVVLERYPDRLGESDSPSLLRGSQGSRWPPFLSPTVTHSRTRQQRDERQQQRRRPVNCHIPSILSLRQHSLPPSRRSPYAAGPAPVSRGAQPSASESIARSTIPMNAS